MVFFFRRQKFQFLKQMNVFHPPLKAFVKCRGIRLRPDGDTENLPGLQVCVDRHNLYDCLPEFLESFLEFQVRSRVQYALVHTNYWLSSWVGMELRKHQLFKHVHTSHSLGAHSLEGDLPPGNLNGLELGVAQERLSIAVTGLAHAWWAFHETLEYVRERKAFGQPIGKFQNTRFLMATLKTELEIGQTYLDAQVAALDAGELTAEDAAMAKWWITELQQKVVDRCLQMHGGYGFMTEYPIAKAWTDARVQTIYGGTTEIMKEIIGRSLGL